jgi:hypothetical protein
MNSPEKNAAGRYQIKVRRRKRQKKPHGIEQTMEIEIPLVQVSRLAPL